MKKINRCFMLFFSFVQTTRNYEAPAPDVSPYMFLAFR